MSYIVNKTDGSQLVEITDGTVDNTTSLFLFGKSYSGYGEYLNENLVKLLENSAHSASPVAPLRGELWFDTSNNQLKVYDGSVFKPTGGAKSQSVEPVGAAAGDLWVDSDDEQLYFRTTSNTWQLVGPQNTKGQQLSGWKVETINDSFGTGRVISSMYNGNTRVAILSSASFTPASAPTGFTLINSGITLNTSLGASFAGTTTTASNVDVSSVSNISSTVIAGGNIMRKDTSQTLAGVLTVLSDTGIQIGTGNDLQISVSGIDANISNVSQDGDISLLVNSNGQTVTPIKIDAANKRVGIFTNSPSVPLEITGNVKIAGNLEITGSYDKASVDISTYVDAFIGVNEGNGTDVNGGLIVERGATGNEARIQWNETTDKWEVGTTGVYSSIVRESDLVSDGNATKGTVLKTDVNGDLKVNNLDIATTHTTITTSSTSSKVATIKQVAETINRWGGYTQAMVTENSLAVDGGSLNSPTGNSIAGRRFIETVAPDANQGANGDLWFVREA